MQAGSWQFRIRRGDRESIGARLVQRDVFSQQLRYLYLADKTLTFTINPPGGQPRVKVWTAQDDGGLVVEQDTAQIVWPLTEADTAALTGGAGNTFSIRVVDPNGEGGTYLTGTILAEG